MTGARIFRIAFVVIACLSLLLNAVALGIGKRLADRGWIGGGVAQAALEIPPEIRRGYVASLRADDGELRRLVNDLRRSRREMLEITARQPPDLAALEQAMAEVRAATARVQEAAHAALLSEVREASE